VHTAHAEGLFHDRKRPLTCELGSGGGILTRDLWVMSTTTYVSGVSDRPSRTW
jgi:hypothetical protein